MKVMNCSNRSRIRDSYQHPSTDQLCGGVLVGGYLPITLLTIEKTLNYYKISNHSNTQTIYTISLQEKKHLIPQFSLQASTLQSAYQYNCLLHRPATQRASNLYY